MTARARILSLSLLVLAAMLLAGALGYRLWATNGPARDSASVIAKAAAAEGVRITPHRALYDLHLADVKNDSGINNAGGQLLFTFGDVCDGWTIEQRLDLAFSYTEGGRQRIQTSLASWEAKNGRDFRFSVRRLVNGKPKEAFDGKAQLAKDGSGGEAHYTQPEVKTVALPPGTLFPTVHTLQLLRTAKSGGAIFTRNVFDGADEEGQNEITAFTSQPVQIAPTSAPASVPAEGDAKPDDKTLDQGRGWPMHLAFFAPDNAQKEEGGMPDYEMSMTLLENGIAHDLTIDYGDFTVNATLRAVEPLPAPSC